MAKEGLEPSTFALLARRSNRLCYSADTSTTATKKRAQNRNFSGTFPEKTAEKTRLAIAL